VGEAVQRTIEGDRLDAGLPVDRVHAQDAGPFIEHRIDPADEAIAAQDWEDVVAVLPFCLRDVHLEAVVEPEQFFRPCSIVDETVER